MWCTRSSLPSSWPSAPLASRRRAQAGPAAVGDNEIVGQHRHPPFGQHRQQAALTRLPSAHQGPGRVNERAGVEDLTARPAAEDRRGRAQVRMHQLIVAEQRPGGRRGALGPPEHKLAAARQVKGGALGADVGALGDAAPSARRNVASRRSARAAGQGRPGRADGFRAHAWLDGDPVNPRFLELWRYPPPAEVTWTAGTSELPSARGMGPSWPLLAEHRRK